MNEQFGYAYDASGNLNTRTNNALIETFSVNNLNELSTVTRSGTLTVAGTTTSTATNVTVNITNATLYNDNAFAKDGFTVTNGNNAYTAIAQDSYNRKDTNSVVVNLPSAVNYIYDLNGNLTSDSTRGFDYDDENELIRVTVTNSWKSEFTYDGRMRRRIRKEFTWQNSAWVVTNEVRYIYDGNLEIQWRDANNLPTLTLTRGLDLSGNLQGAGGIGGLLARTDTGNGQTAYFHADGNGNVTALINSQQVVVAKYIYDPFGNALSKAGPLADANVYRFSSQEYHQNSGLVLYLFRAYDPNLQRFTNRDPIQEEGGMNLYGCVYNDPISRIDLFGLAEWTFTITPGDSFWQPGPSVDVSFQLNDQDKKSCKCRQYQIKRYAQPVHLSMVPGRWRFDETKMSGNPSLPHGDTASAEPDEPGYRMPLLGQLFPLTVNFRWDVVCIGGPNDGKVVFSITRTLVIMRNTGAFVGDPIGNAVTKLKQ